MSETQTPRLMNPLTAWWRLTRGANAILAGAAAWVGVLLATGEWLVSALPGAILTPILIAAAGNIDNDWCDRAIDAGNNSDHPLVTGAVLPAAARLVSAALYIGGLVAAAWCGWWAAALAVFVVLLLLLYNRRLAGVPAAGNLAIALLGALPILYGAVSAAPAEHSRWLAAGLGAMVAFWLHLAREILKDVLDAEGDANVGRRTLAITLGQNAAVRVAGVIMFTAAVFAFSIGLGGWFGLLYLFGVIVTIVPALLLGAAQCGFNPSLEAASRWSAGLKLCMIAGLAWLVLGRMRP